MSDDYVTKSDLALFEIRLYRELDNRFESVKPKEQKIDPIKVLMFIVLANLGIQAWNGITGQDIQAIEIPKEAISGSIKPGSAFAATTTGG